MITNFVQRYTRPKRVVYRPLRDYFNPREFSIEALDFKTAKEFVCRWHYSGSIGACRRTFGLYQKNQLVGCAAYGHPMHERTITNWLGCAQAASGLELQRVVLLDACLSNSESFFIAECHRRLKRENFAGVVSFSDDVRRCAANGEISFLGHLGVFYRGLNGIYTGRGTARLLKLLPDGTTFSDRTAQKIRSGDSGWQYAARILESFGAEECPTTAEAKKQWLTDWLPKLTRPLRHPGNLRYIWDFSKKSRIKSLPYPKIRFSDRQLNLDFK